MDRQTVYAGEIPLETDLLNTNKNTMIALAKQSLLLTGNAIVIHGLNCTPTSPASLVVNIGAGSIYSLQNIDSTAYSSLPADTTHSIPKQGLVLNAQTFTLTAPTTSGQSINYLIQAIYQDVDTGSTVLPYYNAANPSVAWSGPANSGSAQNTVRAGVCSVTVKTGVAATTGMQSTPTPDSGYVGAWVITVANGQTAITSTSIALAPNAPFLPSSGLVAGIQNSALTYAIDTGSANAYTVSYSPPVTQLIDGLVLSFKAKAANTTTSTISVNGLSSAPIYSQSQQALQGGEIVANGLVTVSWNSTLNAFVLRASSGGKLQVPTATASNQAVNLSQMNSAISAAGPSISVFSANGTFTVPAGVTKIKVTCTGAGGGGAGCQASSSSQSFSGSGGGGGGTAIGVYTTTPGTTYTVTVGSGGPGGSGASAGSDGGGSSFGSLCSATGGSGGSKASITSYAGGPGGTATGGAVNINGGYGGDGQQSTYLLTGYGGSSYFGGGGRSAAGGVVPPMAYGSGGGGVYDVTFSGASFVGGAGAAGVVIIEW
jgi:hypothetical protein